MSNFEYTNKSEDAQRPSPENMAADGVNPFATDFRTQAIHSGTLVDVTDTAIKVGFAVPVAVTANLWSDIQAVREEPGQENINDRLLRVLHLARVALQWNQGAGGELSYELLLHVRDSNSYTVKLICGPGDTEDPTITLINPAKDISVSLGRVVMTLGAQDAFQQAGISPAPFIARHQRGDWGELDTEDIEANNISAREEMRILSAYTLPTTQERFWIITEWDRSYTTLLLPSEY